MRLRFVLAITAHVVFFVGLAMMLPLAFALYYGDGDAVPIAWAMGITIAVSGAVSLVVRAPKEDLNRREGMMIATMIWLMAGIFGALPFFIGEMLGPMNLENLINCVFESVSGFTTTGSSVLGASVKIESVGHGLLMWRGLTQWLGGMGIIVLAIAILPLLGVGGMQLFRAEASGHLQEKLRPRIRETAIALWAVYVVMSVIETTLLMFGGMSLYEALCHTFTTLSTGGFSTRDASIAAFKSTYIDVVIIIFMFLGAANFSLHYRAWTRSLRSYFRDSQFRYYVAFTVGGTIFVTAVVWFGGNYSSILETLRQGAFQTVSIMTTTGFVTADYDKWPFAAQLALLIFMFMGGCAGSTTGAIKTVRIVLLFKYAYREIVRLVHPKVFASVKLGGRVIHKTVLESVAAFFIFYILIFVASSLIVMADGMDLVGGLSAVAATLGNIGPGLASVGPTHNYFAVPLLSKCVLTVCMIVGRLEVFTVLVLLTPSFWKK